jgi:hypothetical protein
VGHRDDRRWRQAVAWTDWCPAAGTVAYLALLGAQLPSVLRAVYTSSDAASPLVIAECVGSNTCADGRVTLGHIGYFTTLWLDLLTRWLPSHQLFWELWPFALDLAGVAILVWLALQLGGAWVAATTCALAICASSASLSATLAQGFHGTTWFTVILLGAFLVRLAGPAPPRRRKLVEGVVGVGIVAGLNLASDPLLAVAGLAPFLLASLLVGRPRLGARARWLASIAFVTVGMALAVGLAGYFSMRAAGFSVAPLGQTDWLPSSPGALGSRLSRLVADIGALAGAGPLGHAHGSSLVGRIVLVGCACIMVLALVGQLRAGGRRARDPHVAAAVYLAYWALSALLLCLAFVASRVDLGAGTPSSRYVVGVVYAAAAGVPLLAARPGVGRSLVAGAATGLCVLSSGSLARSDLATQRANLPIVQYGATILNTLEREGLHVGYADYWKAAALTLRGGGSVLIAPISVCDTERARLCAHPINSAGAWYRPRRHTRTFLLVDPFADDLSDALASLGRPRRVERFGPIRLRIYPYDIAARLAH